MIYLFLARVYGCRLNLTLYLWFILMIPFQQVDAVLRAATSIINSSKLRKLFKVIL